MEKEKKIKEASFSCPAAQSINKPDGSMVLVGL
jgi:hypothetical protein